MAIKYDKINTDIPSEFEALYDASFEAIIKSTRQLVLARSAFAMMQLQGARSNASKE